MLGPDPGQQIAIKEGLADCCNGKGAARNVPVACLLGGWASLPPQLATAHVPLQGGRPSGDGASMHMAELACSQQSSC